MPIKALRVCPDINIVSQAIRRRSRGGSRFSIVAVSEGAISKENAAAIEESREKLAQTTDKEERKQAKAQIKAREAHQSGSTLRMVAQLEELTRLESRITILGHLQRGGTPSAADRLLASRVGTACIQLVEEDKYGVMVAARGEGFEAVPLEEVIGKRKMVPLDHPWVTTARQVGTYLGD